MSLIAMLLITLLCPLPPCLQADVMNTLKDDEDTKDVMLEAMGLTERVPQGPAAVAAAAAPAAAASSNGNGVAYARAAPPRKKELVLSDFLE
jgi:hypothetical protein